LDVDVSQYRTPLRQSSPNPVQEISDTEAPKGESLEGDYGADLMNQVKEAEERNRIPCEEDLKGEAKGEENKAKKEVVGESSSSSTTSPASSTSSASK